MFGRCTLMVNRRLGARFEDFDDDHAAAAARTCALVLLRLIDGISSFNIG